MRVREWGVGEVVLERLTTYFMCCGESGVPERSLQPKWERLPLRLQPLLPPTRRLRWLDLSAGARDARGKWQVKGAGEACISEERCAPHMGAAGVIWDCHPSPTACTEVSSVARTIQAPRSHGEGRGLQTSRAKMALATGGKERRTNARVARSTREVSEARYGEIRRDHSRSIVPCWLSALPSMTPQIQKCICIQVTKVP